MMMMKRRIRPAYLPVGVVAGVDTQDAADLHIGEALLQNLHHVQNAQSSTERDLVEHLMKEQRDGCQGAGGEKKKKRVFFSLWWTYRDDGFKRALAVRLVADVVVCSDESHARVLHPVDVVFVRHHEHQADPECKTTTRHRRG